MSAPAAVALRDWIRDCGCHCAGQSVPRHVCDARADSSRPLLTAGAEEQSHALELADREALEAGPCRLGTELGIDSVIVYLCPDDLEHSRADQSIGGRGLRTRLNSDGPQV